MLRNGRGLRRPIEPRPVECPIVRRRLALGQRAPGFDDGLCLTQVVHEGIFGMVASPPAAFIKLDQKIEPLFGKHTPSIEDVLSEVGRAPGVVSLGHGWGQSAGRKTDADATNRINSGNFWIFCGKLWRSPALCGVNMSPLWKRPQDGGHARLRETSRQVSGRPGPQDCDKGEAVVTRPGMEWRA